MPDIWALWPSFKENAPSAGVMEIDASGDITSTARGSIPRSDFGAATADISMGGFKITSLADPVSATDAVNLQTLSLYAAGIKDMKDSVRLATAAGLASYTPSGSPAGDVLTASGNGALSVDGVAVAVNDRILVKNEAGGNAKFNGIYVVTQTGDGSNPYILTRADDFDSSAEVTNGVGTWTGPEGSANPSRMFMLTTADPITLGTTNLTFTLAFVLPSVQAGAGLTETVGVLDIVAADDSMTINANSIQVKIDPARAITVVPGQGIGVNLSGTGGLQIVGNAVGIKLPAGSGLIVDGTGLYVDLAAASGLEFTGNQLRAKTGDALFTDRLPVAKVPFNAQELGSALLEDVGGSFPSVTVGRIIRKAGRAYIGRTV